MVDGRDTLTNFLIHFVTVLFQNIWSILDVSPLYNRVRKKKET